MRLIAAPAAMSASEARPSGQYGRRYGQIRGRSARKRNGCRRPTAALPFRTRRKSRINLDPLDQSGWDEHLADRFHIGVLPVWPRRWRVRDWRRPIEEAICRVHDGGDRRAALLQRPETEDERERCERGRRAPVTGEEG